MTKNFCLAAIFLLSTCSVFAQTSDNQAVGLYNGDHRFGFVDGSGTDPFDNTVDIPSTSYSERIYSHVHFNTNELRDIDSVSDTFTQNLAYNQDGIIINFLKTRMTTTIGGRCRDGLTSRFDYYYENMGLSIDGNLISLPLFPTANQRIDFDGGHIVLNVQEQEGDEHDTLRLYGLAFDLVVDGRLEMRGSEAMANVECHGKAVDLQEFSID